MFCKRFAHDPPPPPHLPLHPPGHLGVRRNEEIVKKSKFAPFSAMMMMMLMMMIMMMMMMVMMFCLFCSALLFCFVLVWFGVVGLGFYLFCFLFLFLGLVGVFFWGGCFVFLLFVLGWGVFSGGGGDAFVAVVFSKGKTRDYSVHAVLEEALCRPLLVTDALA